MSYLLDTHTFIWSIVDETRLSNHTKSILQDASNPIFVSVVTFWEISIKYSLKKLRLIGVDPVELKKAADKNQFTILPLDPEEAASSHQLPLMDAHRDPFDRLLIWQALRNNLTIITKDSDFKLYLPLGLKNSW